MKILIFNEVAHNIDPNSWRKQQENTDPNYHFLIGSIPWGLEVAIEELGYKGLFFNFLAENYVFQNPQNSGGILKFIYRKIRRKFYNIKDVDLISLNEDFLKFVKKYKPDLIYNTGANFILPLTIKRIKELNIPIYLYTGVYPELLKTFVLENLNLYDGIFSCEKIGIKRFKKEFGVKNIYYNSLGAVPSLHKKIDLNEKEVELYGADVSFVGQFSKERLELYRKISKFAKVKIFGTKWPKINEKNLKTYGPVWGYDLVKVYNGAKIVVNIHQPWVKWGINYRVYEVGGCGTFQLVNDLPGLYEQFEVGKELITFKNEEDLFEKLQFYLTHDKEREEIAKLCQQKIYNNYTMKKHMEKVIEVYKKEFS